jgi:hypothetical protein
MRSVDFSQVLAGTAGLMGSTLAKLTAEEFTILRTFADARVRQAWDMEVWPELILVEQRAYRDAYAAGVTYALAAQVYDSTTDAYYQSVQAANLGHAVTDAAWWLPITSFDHYVPWDQTGQTALGTVVAVTQLDPRLTEKPKPMDYEVCDLGIRVKRGTNRPWLSFIRRPPSLFGAVWDSSAAYALADQVYFTNATGVGNFYDALAATTAGQSPTTDPTKWAKTEIAERLSQWLSFGMYADYLIADGQNEKAKPWQDLAQQALEGEIDKLWRLQGQTRRINML